jgi:hypothetical protein
MGVDLQDCCLADWSVARRLASRDIRKNHVFKKKLNLNLI